MGFACAPRKNVSAECDNETGCTPATRHARSARGADEGVRPYTNRACPQEAKPLSNPFRDDLGLLFRDCSVDLAVSEAGGDFVSYFYGVGILQQLAVGIEDQGVTAIENGERRE